MSNFNKLIIKYKFYLEESLEKIKLVKRMELAGRLFS